MAATEAMGAGTALLLGALQGLTEFLPVSSSGHLVLAQQLLGMKEPEMAFDVLLHLGTLLSILFVFRREISVMARRLLASGGIAELVALVREIFGPSRGAAAQKNSSPDASELRLLLLVCLGFVPTAIIALPAHKFIEPLFGSVRAVGFALLGTAAVLASTLLRRPPAGGRRAEIRVSDALLIGAVQGVAAIPGLSRSGTTIAVALLLGIEGAAAARFSFLLAIPAILGAAVVEGPHSLSGLAALLTPATLVGFCAAALTGVAAVWIVVRTARVGRIYLFAPYCLLVGLGAIVYGLR